MNRICCALFVIGFFLGTVPWLGALGTEKFYATDWFSTVFLFGLLTGLCGLVIGVPVALVVGSFKPRR
jgi:hypothetical protein